MFYVIWYHLYNLKNVKNTHGGMLRLESNTPPWVFSRFFNCTNVTKSRNASRMCGERHIPVFGHSETIRPDIHLHKSGLHLSKFGTI